MNLPNVKIIFENGALGSVAASDDGVVGLIATAVEVANKFYLNTPYLLTEFDDLAGLGIVQTPKKADNEETEPAKQNDEIYKAVKEFYTEAPKGSNLWIMGVASSVSLPNIFSEENGDDKKYVRRLVEASNRSINLLIVTHTGAAAGNVTEDTEDTTENTTVDTQSAINPDVYAAMDKAQILAENITNELYAPFFVLLEGKNFDASKISSGLQDLHESQNNRVGILIADTEADTNGACVGLLAGRIASIPVQRSIARVRTGAIKNSKMYIGSELAENGKPEILHGKGYITARTFVGKAGYYWSDDLLATQVTDDYALIPRRRVIDKAFRIAYKTLIEEIGESIPVTEEGKIPASTVKNIQNTVERAIESNMTAYGNLGNDPGDSNDTGVECYIDPDQEVYASSELKIQLRVKPHGYSKYIDISLGFKTFSEE
jgi:hypothetical protein